MRRLPGSKLAFTTRVRGQEQGSIKTLLPLVENYDFDTARQILVDAVDADSSIAGIRYRFAGGRQAGAG